jgi:putative ATPase
MVYAGEDPRFIFRRLIIFAGEDIGLADPRALEQMIAAAQAFDYVGMPEGRYHLAQAVLYAATAPKSNSTMALLGPMMSIPFTQITKTSIHSPPPTGFSDTNRARAQAMAATARSTIR